MLRFRRQIQVGEVEHGGEAILDVEVGFALGAIAQHAEMVGMGDELAVKS